MTDKRHRMSINKITEHRMPVKNSQGHRHKMSLNKRKRHKMSINKKRHRMSVSKKRHRMSKNKNRHKMSINKIRQKVDTDSQTKGRTAEELKGWHIKLENKKVWRKGRTNEGARNGKLVMKHARWRGKLQEWIRHGGEGQAMTAD